MWKTKNLNLGGKGIRNLNCAGIADQVKFVDTIKFYQEPLYALAASMEPTEKENINLVLRKHPNLSFKYSTLRFDNKKWVIEYLSSGKGVISYEMIKQWEDLNIVPSITEFFFPKTAFYSSLKNSNISDQEHQDVQKLFCLMKMLNLLDLNDYITFRIQ